MPSIRECWLGRWGGGREGGNIYTPLYMYMYMLIGNVNSITKTCTCTSKVNTC